MKGYQTPIFFRDGSRLYPVWLLRNYRLFQEYFTEIGVTVTKKVRAYKMSIFLNLFISRNFLVLLKYLKTQVRGILWQTCGFKCHWNWTAVPCFISKGLFVLDINLDWLKEQRALSRLTNSVRNYWSFSF